MNGRGESQLNALVALDLVDASIRDLCLPSEIGPAAHDFDYSIQHLTRCAISNSRIIHRLSFRSHVHYK